MNATAGAVSVAPGVSARGVDRWIFTAIAALFIVIALAGFIPTSLSKIAAVEAGRRPPFPVVLHVHVAVMGLWLLLLMTQAVLVATNRRALHQKLGVIGVVLLPAIVISGTVLFVTWWHALWSVAAAAAPADALAAKAGLSNFLLFNGRILLSFPVFIGWALLVRRSDPDAHKRLMFLGTAIPLVAGSDRLSTSLGMTTLPGSPLGLELLMLASVLPLIAYDLMRRGRLHRTSLVWLVVNAVLAILTRLMWSSPWWIAVAPRLMGVQS